MTFLNLNLMLSKDEKTTMHGWTFYTRNGKMHRDGNLPALISPWSQEWYVHGVAHRDDGPAKLYLKHPKPTGDLAKAANGERIAEWYDNGEYKLAAILDEKTFNKHWHKEEL